MKHVWKMLMAALLACMLFLPVVAEADELKGVCRNDDVSVRVSPDTSANVEFELDAEAEVTVVDFVIADGRVTWLKIEYKHPILQTVSTGYAAFADIEIVVDDEAPSTPDDEDPSAPGDEETSEPDDEETMKPSTDSTLGGGDVAYEGQTVTGVKGAVATDTAFYDQPSTSGKSIGVIPADTVVDVTGIPNGTPLLGWYRVVYGNKVGFVHGSQIEVDIPGTDEEEDDDDVVVQVKTATGVIAKDDVLVYAKMDDSTNPTRLLNKGMEVVLLSNPVKANGTYWYKISCFNEAGYVQYNDITDVDTGYDNAFLAWGVTANTNGVNFRKGSGVDYESMAKLPSGVVVELITIPAKTGTNYWYEVRYEGKTGYIQSPYMEVLKVGENGKTEDTPTEAPEVALVGGVIVNTNGVNFRKGPGTGYESMAKLTSGTKVELLAIPEKFDANHWYKVRYDGKVGYIQAPYVEIDVDGDGKDEEDVPTDTPADPDEEENKVIGYGVTVNTNGVHFRQGPGTEYTSMDKLVSGVFVELVSIPEVKDSKNWYKVIYNDKVGYIQAPYIQVLYSDLPTEAPTEDPDHVVVKAKGRIVNTNGVNFRKSNSIHADSMGLLKSGVEVELLSIPEMTTSSYWYKVRYDGKIGYIQAPYIKVLGADGEEEEPTATPAWDEDVIGIGMITSTNGVNFRKTPSVNGTSMGKLTAGVTVDLLKIPAGSTSEYWYKICYKNQDGYVQAPYVIVLEGDIPGGGESTSDVLGIGTVTSTDGVNFRTGPGKQYSSMGKLTADTNVELLYIPSQVDEDNWYKVRYNNKTGYIQSIFIRILTVNEDALPDAAVYGYAKLMEASANLRESPYGETITNWKGKGSLLRITGEMVASGYYEWIPVYYPADSAIYYVRSDVVQIVTVENGQIVTPTPAPSSIYGYVLTTGTGVNLRIQPGEESLAQIPRNTVLVCVGDPVIPWGSDYTWYEVKYNGMVGFVRGDYVRVCDQNGDPVDDEDDDSGNEEIYIYGYIKLNTGNKVNLREKPLGSSMGLLANGLILPVIDETIPKGMYGQYTWYKVRTADGQTGYIRGDCVAECDAMGNEIEPTPTPVPTETIRGYVMITGNKVNLREEPFGSGLGQMNTSTVWPIIGETKVVNQITWYNIRVNNLVGYVHGDYAVQLTDAQVKVWQETGVVPEITTPSETVMSNHVITVNTNGLNIRESYSMDSASVGKVGSGVVMEFIGTKKVGTVTWYNVIYQDVELWAHGGYLQVLTQAEYNAYLAENPDYIPNVADNVGYVRTVQDNVYIRNAANGSTRIDVVSNEGTVLPYYAAGIQAGEYDWFRIYYDGQFGYVRSDLVEKCEKDGTPLPSNGTNLGDTSSAPKSQQESSYSTLELGDSGVAVTNLVNELKNQGYYTGSVTSSYTSKVKTAVELFQAAKGLYANGIANSSTQHALFGTVPIGAGDTSNLDFAIYPVEKIDWFTGGIQELLPRGANFKVYDVKTGIVWWAHRWAGSYHADIETLTKADSNRLCKIYGVDTLAEIVQENMWQRRPCLVTIGTRTFACSLDGMQHNPDGDTISNNGMDGQICLHFTNSKGHESNSVSSSHKEAIEYAYNNCPAGQK